MNKAMRWIWLLAGCVIALSLAALLFFWAVDGRSLPACFWLIPTLYLVLTFVLGAIAKHYASPTKKLSVGSILGIRAFFIGIIITALIISVLIDRAHVFPIAVLYILFTLLFLFFETKILLLLNKKEG